MPLTYPSRPLVMPPSNELHTLRAAAPYLFETDLYERSVPDEAGDTTELLYINAVNHSLHRAIANAGVMFRDAPHQAIADELVTLPPDDAEVKSRERVLAEILTTILNDSIEPYTGDDALPTFTSERVKPISGCREAEYLYGRTFYGMRRAKHERAYNMAGYRIVVDDTDQAIMVQKGDDIASAMSLAPIVVNGVRYPTGSIMRIELGDEQNPDYLHPNTPQRRMGRFVVQASEIEKIGLMRMSTFVFDPNQRRGTIPPPTDTTFQIESGIEAHRKYSMRSIAAAATARAADLSDPELNRWDRVSFGMGIR